MVYGVLYLYIYIHPLYIRIKHTRHFNDYNDLVDYSPLMRKERTIMTGTFYIAHSPTVGGTWYMLCVRDTHFCISCGSDLERILKSLSKCVKRVRYKERLLRELSGLDCGGTVSPATFEQREEWYRLHGEAICRSHG